MGSRRLRIRALDQNPWGAQSSLSVADGLLQNQRENEVPVSVVEKALCANRHP